MMLTCTFLLSGFTLSTDNALFRAHETCIHQSFESVLPLVVRDTRGWEAPYGRVKRVRLPFVPQNIPPSFSLTSLSVALSRPCPDGTT